VITGGQVQQGGLTGVLVEPPPVGKKADNGRRFVTEVGQGRIGRHPRPACQPQHQHVCDGVTTKEARQQRYVIMVPP
jgi:hypothetical protein